MARSEPERKKEGVPRTENTGGTQLLSPWTQGPLGINGVLDQKQLHKHGVCFSEEISSRMAW